MRALIIVVLVAIAGYYIYKEMSGGGDEAPSCNRVFESCEAKCRKTETETDPYNACMKKCRSALEECK